MVGVPNNPGTPHVPAITITLGSLTKQLVFHPSDHTHMLTHTQWFTCKLNCQTKHAPSSFLEVPEGLLFITTAELIRTVTCQSISVYRTQAHGQISRYQTSRGQHILGCVTGAGPLQVKTAPTKVTTQSFTTAS